MNYSKRHFHTFDALRFFAFLKVFLLHLPIVAFPAFNFLKNGGGTGVVFFFVLSGFLITYILLTEKEATGVIDLKKFFLRRILRIWPLYFLMVAFAFVTPYILSHLNFDYSSEGYQPNWFTSFTFLENYKMIFVRGHPNVSPLSVTWSLCVEEHFYIIWGLLLYFINTKKLPVVFISGIIIAFTSRYIFLQNNLPTIDILTNIDYFIYGAVPAYFLVKGKARFEKFFSDISINTKLLFIALIVLYVVISPNIFYPSQVYIEPLILGLSFCFLICTILPQKNAIQISDKIIFSRLGLYTYGMYMYHTIIINLFLHLFEKYQIPLENPWYAIIFVWLTIAVTILVSMISYHFFEKYFLELKKRFAKDRLISNETITAFAGYERAE